MVNYFTEDDGGSGGFARFLNPQGAIATLAGARHYRPVDELIAEQKARGNYRINNGVPEFNVVETVDVQNTTSLNLRSEEHTSDLQSLMRISYDVFCLKK